MKKSITIVALTALGFFANSATAGPYGDALAKCLVSSTSSVDRTTLVQWMFATAALHPDVRRLSSASAADREKLNKSMAAIFERLLTKSCISETKEAVRFEGSATLEASFNVLGQVAGRELFSHPDVAGSMTGFTKFIDQQKIKEALTP